MHPKVFDVACSASNDDFVKSEAVVGQPVELGPTTTQADEWQRN